MPDGANHVAFAYSADGKGGITTVYPNLNLLDGTSSVLKTESAKAWGYNHVDHQPNVLNLKKGQTLTYSVWIQDCDVDSRGVVYLYDSQDKQYNYFGNTVKAGTSGWSNITFTIDIDVSKYTIAVIGFLANQSEFHSFKYSRLKLELGSIATPWMPSASEVTPKDYPSYIGTYTDNDSSKQSTDPARYSWKKIE